MSDILKVTTPMINKNQPIAPKQGAQPLTPFDIQDLSRVVRTHNQSELQQQNNGLIDSGDGPVLLMNLLKDPAVAASYLKNIFLLEEIFKLLPANNKTVTKEIQQIFNALVMQESEIKGEMLRQENASTMFKGDFFDFLREISNAYKESPEVQYSVATLLKSINNLTAKKDIIDAIANSLEFLKNSLSSSQNLSQELESLINQFKAKDAVNNFQSLKEQTLGMLDEVENSILFSPKLSKVLSIIVYNLSRFNNSLDFFNESSYRLHQLLKNDERQQFVQLMELFSKGIKEGKHRSVRLGEDGQGSADTHVMDALIKLVERQAKNENIAPTDAAKIDKILYSLLSSPCNFTPLLHFIVPVFHDNMRAFAEIWINPNSDEKDMPDGVKEGKHFLLVIDVADVGRFEAEFFVYDRTLDFHLFCPPGYQEKYEPMMKSLPKVLGGMAYRIGETKLLTLERPRSLMDVFKSLPYKRVGVDVKI